VKIKLDENFGRRTQQIFLEAGHDVQTVLQEAIPGVSDQQLYEICLKEGRCLITLDLDFSNVLRFPPDPTSGIVVIRLPRNPTLSTLERLVRQFLQAASQMPVANKLWIVEAGRVRVHQTDTGEEV
jgi:predicted nuclease of predicted toxin-antitoxin system